MPPAAVAGSENDHWDLQRRSIEKIKRSARTHRRQDQWMNSSPLTGFEESLKHPTSAETAGPTRPRGAAFLNLDFPKPHVGQDALLAGE